MKKNELSDLVIKLLKDAGKPLQLLELSKIFKYKSNSKEYQALKETLANLVKDGLLVKSKRRRYSLCDEHPSSLIEGTLKIIGGRGVLETEDAESIKVIIKQRNMNCALDGDRVLVKLLAVPEGKKFRGEVIKIVERSANTFVGTIEADGSFYFLIPDDDRYYIDFLVNADKLNGAKDGDKVSARLDFWDDNHKSPVAEVLEIIGKSGDVGVLFNSILKEYSLPERFSAQAESEASDVPTVVKPKALDSRLDFRKHTVITIDPPDAKDFDDALSIETLENGIIRLGVHIADVSHYVAEGSSIDKEARKRGNSTYLVDQVVPMLPEKLSNEVCSLKPNTNRLTFSVIMDFTAKGKLLDYQIGESVIKSKKRFNYDEVQKIIEGAKTSPLKDTIMLLHSLAQTLRKKRFQTGGIDFESKEPKFILGEDKRPVNVVLRTSNEATQLVEECMLAANKTVAAYVKTRSKELKQRGMLPFFYRIHDEPIFLKLANAMQVISSFSKGAKLKEPKSKDINNFLKQFEDSPNKSAVHQLLLRAMAKAEYSEQNIGHYGLGFSDYCHFTSPIRRYPDLIVHRLIKKYLKCEKLSAEEILKQKRLLSDLGAHCTATERNSMEAERASIKLAQSLLAKDNLYKVFEGTISGVTSFGLFVEIDGILAEGFIHIRDLHDDYYTFDEKQLRLVGRHHKKIYAFGKRLSVKIIEVDVGKRRIELALAE
jgi:ribonuclease R